MGKGCIDCKNKSVETDPRKCNSGHTVLLEEWFLINGNRTREMGFINNHACFEPYEVSVLLDNAIQATDEMIKKLRGS